MTDAALQTYFKFDEADLAANQKGQFSEKQKARLAALGPASQRERKIVGMIFICVAVAVLAWDLLGPPSFFVLRSLEYAMALISGAVGVYLLLPSAPKNKKYKLRKMQGIVSYSRHVNKDMHGPVLGYWIIHVGKSWLYVAETTPKFLIPGQEYNVYTYASQGSTFILSAEPVQTV
jgi:hypothetical protein